MGFLQKGEAAETRHSGRVGASAHCSCRETPDASAKTLASTAVSRWVRYGLTPPPKAAEASGNAAPTRHDSLAARQAGGRSRALWCSHRQRPPPQAAAAQTSGTCAGIFPPFERSKCWRCFSVSPTR
jgi:hypothetical protein